MTTPIVTETTTYTAADRDDFFPVAQVRADAGQVLERPERAARRPRPDAT